MTGRDQPGEDGDAAGIQVEIVVAATELDSAHFDDLQASPLPAELLNGLVQLDDAMADAVKVKVAVFRGLVVEQQNRTVEAREEMLERQYLPAIAQGALRQ